MEKEDAIELVVLAILWMLVITMVVFFVAMTYPDEGDLLTFQALHWLWWAYLFIGMVVVYTIVFIIRQLTGWRLDKKQQILNHRLWAGFTLLVMVIFLAMFFFDENFHFSGLRDSSMVLLILFPFGIFLVIPVLHQVLTPLTDDQVEDHRERELDLDLSYDQALALCEGALDSLDPSDIIQHRTSDPETGTLSVLASPLFFLPVRWPTRITISLKENDRGTTHLRISCISEDIRWNPLGIQVPGDINQNYLDRLTLYLLEKTGQHPELRDTLSPEVYEGRS